MSMTLDMNWSIVTEDKARRMEQNTFTLEKTGYDLYPLDVPIPIKVTRKGKPFGIAVITKLEWTQQSTMIQYELKQLDGVN